MEDQSITTTGVQKLFLGRDDADLICGKRILIMDDVISTGGSLKAMEALVEKAGGIVTDFSDTAPNVLRPSSVFASNARCHSVLKELEL